VLLLVHSQRSFRTHLGDTIFSELDAAEEVSLF
jgi:hypothetical protein